MRAVVQERYGDPGLLEVREVPAPEPGDGEMLVRVRAASLHPDVWHTVRGRPWVLRTMGAGLLRPSNPIPGTDMAGVVTRVGPGVTRYRPGDAVFGETVSRHPWTHGGAFAEYVVVRPEWMAAKPDGVGFEEAASVPTSGFIALQNLRGVERLPRGARVLVNGAGGGVGSLALQIAKAHGLHVTAVDSGAKSALLRSLGADRVLDHVCQDFTAEDVRYDLIFDVPGNRPLGACRKVLGPDGRYVLVGHEGYGRVHKPLLGLFPDMVRLMLLSLFVRHLRSPGVPPPSRGEAMALLAGYLARGVVTPAIDRAYPLEEVREAMRHMVEDPLLGKVLLRMGEEG